MDFIEKYKNLKSFFAVSGRNQGSPETGFPG
jgi:hypothetical protein